MVEGVEGAGGGGSMQLELKFEGLVTINLLQKFQVGHKLHDINKNILGTCFCGNSIT